MSNSKSKKTPFQSAANTANNSDTLAKKKIRDEIGEIMQQVSQPSTSENQLCRDMKALYARTDKKTFVEVFFRMMVVPFSRPEVTIKPLLKFCHRIITSLDNVTAQPGQSSNPESNNSSFRVRFLRLFAKTHADINPLVRERLVQAVNKIFATYRDVQEEIERNCVNTLKNALFHRMKDKSVDVRAEAAIALSYLQEKQAQESSPVGERLIFHLRFDPAAPVRKAIVEKTAFLKEDLDYLIETVHDKQESVRVAGYITLAKYPITAFNSRAKDYIISAGSQDKSAAVEKVLNSLVNTWYEGQNKDVLELLKHFDLVGQRKIAETVLHIIFPDPDNVTFKKVDWKIFVDTYVPSDSLTEQKAFFWRFIVAKFANSEYAVNIMPSVAPMCEYIRQFVDVAKNTAADSTILVELLQLLVIIPLEEGGRYVLKDLMRILSTYKYIGPIHVKYLVLIHHKTPSVKTEDEFLKFVGEIMSGAKAARENSQEVENSPDTEVEELSQETTQKLKLEAGKLVHERYELIKEQNMLLGEKQLRESNLVQTKIDKLDSQIKDLRSRLGYNPNCSYNATANQTNLNVEEDLDESIDFPDIALELGFCAVIVYLRLHKTVRGPIQEFVQSFSKVGLRCILDGVRCRFLEMSTLVALSNPEIAVPSMVTCVSALLYDVDCVKFTAVGCIFDLTNHYSLEFFDGDVMDKVIRKSRVLEEIVKTNREPAPLKIIILYLLKMNDISIRKRTVLGICKLFLTSRIKSPSIIATLMTLWSNPQNETSTIFRDITAWLPNYTKMGLEQACLIADCVVPSCTRILLADRDPSLKNTSMEKFVEFIVSNTDQRVLVGIEDAHSIHERIATNVLDEMVAVGNGAALTQYALMLKTLNLEGIKAVGCKSLKRSLLKIKAFAKTNQVKNSLEAFEKYLEKFESEFDPSDLDLSSIDLTNPTSVEVRTNEDEEDNAMQTSDQEMRDGVDGSSDAMQTSDQEMLDFGEGDCDGNESDDMFE